MGRAKKNKGRGIVGKEVTSQKKRLYVQKRWWV